MTEAEFYKQFTYNIYEFNNHHFTDNSKKPVQHHYFGCLITGTAIIKTKKAELSLKPNEIFYIPKGLKYQSEWFGEKIKFYSFGFKISPINQSFVLQKVNFSNEAKNLFDELCKDINSPQKSIGKLFYFFEQVADGMKRSDSTPLHPTIQKAIESINENPNQRISDIAKHCNISEPGIYSLFKRHLNKTPNALRNQILCDKAISLLTTTNKSVQEISDTVGFSSASYFRKILRKHTGKTPLQIRKGSAF